MTAYHKSYLIALLVVAVSSLRVLAAEDQADIPLRMANGTVIAGTVQEATPGGLVIQGEKGQYTAPWKYLSAGTRYRYELPMLAEQEAARALALKKAQAAAAKKEAAEKAAAAKAAATNATGTNAVGVVSNMPPAKK
ncbi:MAG: hypothetical protein KJ964_08150 [Verrucomicrobia bacterium]|nr:hypothetical protein [Verrucomicrobiota bacterium]MBU1735543.1 hypothetical protein [Verrucomicrobiota bacterium]MBU1858010.1 hypothetical protein [Verrucomicrobiota bacterium]